MKIEKNRNREKFSFANINLLGKCNARCYFCLGLDIENEIKNVNNLHTHFLEWQNFDKFIKLCKEHRIKKIYLTGQSADGLQYSYLDELVVFLQEKHGFDVGVRSNGYLALEKMESIKKMREEIGYTINSLNPVINKKIMLRQDIPEWERIIPLSGPNTRISIVLNRYNVPEIPLIIEFLSSFENVKYIQLRRISTDTRLDLLEKDIELFEEFYNYYSKKWFGIDTFSGAPVYAYKGKEISFWRTVETTTNSINYFTNGVISDEYFIVEGYLKHKNNV